MKSKTHKKHWEEIRNISETLNNFYIPFISFLKKSELKTGDDIFGKNKEENAH